MTQNVNTASEDRRNQASAFRTWVHNLWFQNYEEHLTFGEEPYKIQEYWNKYKWWIKREYRKAKK